MPFSTCFLALSHAPPAFAIIRAIRTQPRRAPANIPPSASGLIKKPTKTGAATAITPGRTIFLSAAVVAISTHLAVSGSALPSNSPLISLNCLLTSSIISNAASPTAVIVRDAIKNGIVPPIRRPIKTSALFSLSMKSSEFALTVSVYAVMIARAARAAAPMANPLPIAAVVLPSSSSESVILRVSSPRPAISAIPPALSAIGP